MADEQQNVIVNAPNSAPSSNPPTTTPSSEVIAPAIQQAETFGAAMESFRRAESEAQQTRLEMQLLREQQTSDRESNNRMFQEIQAQNQRLITAIEEEEEEETPQPVNSNGATIVTPPAIAVPTTPEQPPKKKQSRANLILFGRDDEE